MIAERLQQHWIARHGAVRTRRCLTCGLDAEHRAQVEQGRAVGVSYDMLAAWLRSEGIEHPTPINGDAVRHHFRAQHTAGSYPEPEDREP